jgi:hypothetical protein
MQAWHFDYFTPPAIIFFMHIDLLYICFLCKNFSFPRVDFIKLMSGLLPLFISWVVMDLKKQQRCR